jgi:hypothetical protein
MPDTDAVAPVEYRLPEEPVAHEPYLPWRISRRLADMRIGERRGPRNRRYRASYIPVSIKSCMVERLYGKKSAPRRGP